MKGFLFVPAILCAVSGAASAVVVQFDFNTAASVTQAGWTGAPLGNGSGGGVTIATTAIGAVTVDSRDRVAANTDGAGADIGNNDMWRDFVFALNSFSAAPGTGLSLALLGLSPNTTYPITIWAFDDLSNAQADGFARAADWSGGGGGGTLAFPSTPDPTSLTDYSVTFNALTDGAGALTIRGTVAATNPSASHNVFINGLRIGDAIPEPSTGLLGVVALGAMVLRRRR
jgi:hypothetical protein